MNTRPLNQNRDFRAIYARGKSFAGGCLVLYFRKNRQDTTRLGITASTKLGCAPRRNRIRRRIHEVFRLNEHKFIDGIDIVIVARNRSYDVPFLQLQGELLRLAAKLGILQDNK